MDWDINIFRGVITLVVMFSFLGICFQAYRSKNRAHFEEAGNLPFVDNDDHVDQTQHLTPDNHYEEKVANHE